MGCWHEQDKIKFKNMKKHLFLSLLTIPAFLSAQSYDCLGGDFARVQTPSGLSLREKPERQSPRLALIPDQSILWLCHSGQDAPETIEGQRGTWIRTCYGKKEGYVFSRFLETEIKTGLEIIAPHEWQSGWNAILYKDTSWQWGVFPTSNKKRFKIAHLTYKDTVVEVEKGRSQKRAFVITPRALPILLFRDSKWQPTQRIFDGYLFENSECIFSKNFLLYQPKLYLCKKISLMARKDNFHLPVKNALEKDGWLVTHAS